MIKRLETSPLLSKITICNDTAYLSGLVNADRDGIADQTADLLDLLEGLLKTAGTTKSNIAHLLIHLKTLDDYAAFNEVYKTWIDPQSVPSRTCVQAELPNPKALVEITAVVAIDS